MILQTDRKKTASMGEIDKINKTACILLCRSVDNPKYITCLQTV